MKTTKSEGNVLLWILIGIAIITTGTAAVVTLGDQEERQVIEDQTEVMLEEEELPVNTGSTAEGEPIEIPEEPETSVSPTSTSQPLPEEPIIASAPQPTILPEPEITEPPAATTTATTTETIESEELSFRIEADDNGAQPDEINVPRGSFVVLTFFVKTENVRFGGLDFKTPNFSTGTIKPGEEGVISFSADEDTEFQAFWPGSDTVKDYAIRIKVTDTQSLKI